MYSVGDARRPKSIIDPHSVLFLKKTVKKLNSLAFNFVYFIQRIANEGLDQGNPSLFQKIFDIYSSAKSMYSYSYSTRKASKE